MRFALRARVQALEAKLDAVPRGKGKGRQDTKERKALMQAHDEALDALAQYTLDAGDGIDADDEIDDFDALVAGMDGADDDDGEAGSFLEQSASIDLDQTQDDDDEEEEEETALQVNEGNDNPEPSSFSRVPTALLHQYLGLSSAAVVPPDTSTTDFPNLRQAQAPYVVELNAGEMLYLPASWWHEVTSSSSVDDSEAIHMAFNYWFYPPTRLDNFKEPYEDTLVWEHLRSKMKARLSCLSEASLESGKRKGDTIIIRDAKRTKR